MPQAVSTLLLVRDHDGNTGSWRRNSWKEQVPYSSHLLPNFNDDSILLGQRLPESLPFYSGPWTLLLLDKAGELQSMSCFAKHC